MGRSSFFVLSIRHDFRTKSLFFKDKKIKYNQYFISKNRVYCTNKPTNYQIWCMFVLITTFVCVHPSQKQEENNAFCRVEYFYHSFCPFSRCNAVVSLLKNSNIIFLLRLLPLLINQFTTVYCGLICLEKFVERCCGDG